MAKIPVFPIPGAGGGGGIKWTKLRDEDFTIKATAAGSGTYYSSKSIAITDLQYDIYVAILTGTLAISLKSGTTGAVDGSIRVGGTSTYTFANKRLYLPDGGATSAPISCRIVLVPESNADWPNVGGLYGRPFQGSFVSPGALEVKISAEGMRTVTDFSGHISIHGGRYEF